MIAAGTWGKLLNLFCLHLLPWKMRITMASPSNGQYMQSSLPCQAPHSLPTIPLPPRSTYTHTGTQLLGVLKTHCKYFRATAGSSGQKLQCLRTRSEAWMDLLPNQEAVRRKGRTLESHRLQVPSYVHSIKELNEKVRIK